MRAAGEAKAALPLISDMFRPAWLWLLAFFADRFKMTALTNATGAGDPTLQAQLADPSAALNVEPAVPAMLEPDAWRNEVAARLARYRTRRKPRAPRYPSLRLPFDSGDSWSRPLAASASAMPSAIVDAPVQEEISATWSEYNERSYVEPSDVEPSYIESAHIESSLQPDFEPESLNNVIEFPRSAAIPIFDPSPLADPILDRPRILEAPEVVLPPPALGGILIEPVRPEPAERRANEPVIVSASIRRRLLAAFLDGLIVMAAVAAFAAIFLRLNPIRGPLPIASSLSIAGSLPILGAAAGALTILFWMGYQYLFVVFTGSTPGLRTCRLRVAKLDGSPVERRVRRWRVLASFLSAFSAGLGYVWCFLDQDSLGWHDRISRTYVQVSPPKEPKKKETKK